jgi:hypothetical protein
MSWARADTGDPKHSSDRARSARQEQRPCPDPHARDQDEPGFVVIGVVARRACTVRVAMRHRDRTRSRSTMVDDKSGDQRAQGQDAKGPPPVLAPGRTPYANTDATCPTHPFDGTTAQRVAHRGDRADMIDEPTDLRVQPQGACHLVTG